MVSLKKYNLKGEEVGEVDCGDEFFDVEANQQMIKDYIVALRANIRQWSASTRGRSEINHSNKKPHRQKGTGNARQGTLAAPQYRGGGIVFGPKPKFNVKIRTNQKERQAAIRQLLSQKMHNKRLIIVEDHAFNGALKKPKTQTVAKFLKSQELSQRKALFVGEGSYENLKGGDGERRNVSISSEKHIFLKKSMRNLPGCMFISAAQLNGYDVLAAYAVIMTESALKELQERLQV